MSPPPGSAVGDGMHAAALRLADEMARRAGEIGVAIQALPNGTRLIDAGVAAAGSHEAGRLYAEACLGGLGQVAVGVRRLGAATLSEARVTVDAPLDACMGSQYAGWKIQVGKFFAMGSGPARSLAAVEPLFQSHPLRSRSDRTVLLLETSVLPGAEVADHVASRCGIEPARLTLVAASTGSLAGCTQIAARSVETALHKLMELGFDLGTIVAGAGTCPIAPGIPDPLRAIGRTNDAVLYGAAVSLWVRADDRAIEAVIGRLPSSASKEHGRLFYDLFKEHGDFYAIDPMLFSPAQVTLVNAATGRVWSAGATDEGLLRKSFGIDG
ncbi:MAG TPA: methenyltetrahydromethanopterin cyclohydrolase [Candidatus Polarisedimenticolia bacterium]|nr:methenyltetrahydromethanopterin cyclohydrolase [Candidatus Polarisedimenticolia bacterium]